jgi:tRNA (uracil-5-)-methyltransferase
MSIACGSISSDTSNDAPVIIRVDGEHITKCFPEDYEDLLVKKTNILKSLLSSYINDKVLEVFPSPVSNYRMRANFNVWRDKPRDDNAAGMYYAMFEKDGMKKIPCEIKSFPRGSVLMNDLMVKFMEVIKDSPSLRQSLFEARFVTTQTNNAIIALCYRKPLTPEWQVEAEAAAKVLNVKIVGRSRKVKQIAGVRIGVRMRVRNFSILLSLPNLTLILTLIIILVNIDR